MPHANTHTRTHVRTHTHTYTRTHTRHKTQVGGCGPPTTSHKDLGRTCPWWRRPLQRHPCGCAWCTGAGCVHQGARLGSNNKGGGVSMSGCLDAWMPGQALPLPSARRRCRCVHDALLRARTGHGHGADKTKCAAAQPTHLPRLGGPHGADQGVVLEPKGGNGGVQLQTVHRSPLLHQVV